MTKQGTLEADTFEVLGEGFIHRCDGSEYDGAAVTSRCVATRTGELLCSYMTQSGLSQNDFLPQLAASTDHGQSWQSRGPIWPHLHEQYSINASISRSPDGELFLFGSRTPRTNKGESFWSQQTLGILQNELIWSRSSDDGKTWLDPQAIPVPLPGAAEVPAPLCITSSGRWVAPYAPHNTFDPDLQVDLQHIVTVASDDEGETWQHNTAIRVNEDESYLAEAWISQLANGDLLATAWHLNRNDGDDYPNTFAISHDDGRTWQPKHTTTIQGQSAGHTSTTDGKLLFAYNQRRHGTPGVWLAIAQPDEDNFNLLANKIAWSAAQATQNASSGKSTSWTDFAFGEPSVTALPDGTSLVVFWCIQPDGSGIRFVKLNVS